MPCTGGELGLSWAGGSQVLLPTRQSTSRYQAVSSTDVYLNATFGNATVRAGKLSIYTDGAATYAQCNETRYIDPRKNKVITECSRQADGIGEAKLAAEWIPDLAFVEDVDVPVVASDLGKYLSISFTEPYYRTLAGTTPALPGTSLTFSLPTIVSTNSPYGQFLSNNYGINPGEIAVHQLPVIAGIPLYQSKLVCLDYLSVFPLTVDWVNWTANLPSPTRPSLVYSIGTDMYRLLPARAASVYEVSQNRGSYSQLDYTVQFNGGRNAIPGQLFNKGFMRTQGSILLYQNPCA